MRAGIIGLLAAGESGGSFLTRVCPLDPADAP
jgi:hypothetical protein